MTATMPGAQDGPQVTVAIPVYNSAATLERCIRSALRQSLREIEVLVADDASTDGSAEIAERLAAEDPRITVLRLPTNGGKPHAMNLLIDAARGTWVAVLDADDAYHHDRLERLICAASAAPDGSHVDMVADNILYLDGGADAVVRTAFPVGAAPRIVTRRDLAANSDSYAEFDFGILKPVMRRAFLQQQGLAYTERTRLSEDFYYLMHFFAAGGTGLLVSEPLYYWTMPFGTISRKWTQTGAGAWRYDYRQALQANEHFIAEMAGQGQQDMVHMLQARSRQYRAMIPYLDAQRCAAGGSWLRSAAIIAGHPRTWRLLAGRVAGRLRRRFAAQHGPALAGHAAAHPSLRSVQ